MASQESEPTVTESAVPQELAEVLRLHEGVVFLPQRWADDGRGIYGESSLFMVKELRAEGVQASFLDPSPERLFEVKKSALADAILTINLAIATGVMGNAAWAGIKRMFKRISSDAESSRALRVDYLHLTDSGELTQYQVTGSADDVIAAIDHIRGENPGGTELDSSSD